MVTFPVCLFLWHWAQFPCKRALNDSQQVVLIAHFNQLHRWREPFRLDRYKYLSSSPLFWTRLQREQSIYLTLHTAAGLLAAVMTAQRLKKKRRKRSELSCPCETTWLLIKPVVWGVLLWLKMMASRGVYVWGIVLLVFSVTAFVTYINQCPQWNGSLNLWFEKKSFGCLSHGWITEKAHWPHAQEPPEPVKKLWMFPVGKSSNFQRDAKWLQRDW